MVQRERTMWTRSTEDVVDLVHWHLGEWDLLRIVCIEFFNADAMIRTLTHAMPLGGIDVYPETAARRAAAAAADERRSVVVCVIRIMGPWSWFAWSRAIVERSLRARFVRAMRITDPFVFAPLVLRGD